MPQNGDVSLTDGQLETLKTTAGRCACEAPTLSSKVPTIATEVSTLASSEEIKKRAAEKKPTPVQVDAAATQDKQEPVYQVFMPPLQYDAKAKVQADYDPSLIVLVRRVRVRPTLIFQGRVEGDPVVARTVPTPAAASEKPADTVAPKPAEETTWNRVRTYFKKLLGPAS